MPIPIKRLFTSIAHLRTKIPRIMLLALLAISMTYMGCQLKAYDCRQNDDCSSSQICALGWCREAGQRICDRDGSCPPGMTCRAGICEGTPSGCKNDADCLAPQVCRAGACKAPTTPKCQSDNQCDTHEQCVAGTCQTRPPECTSDSDCSQGKRCINNECQTIPTPGCKSDGDCNANEICSGGQCVEKPSPGCKRDSDCAQGERCISNACQKEDPCASGCACIPSNRSSSFDSTPLESRIALLYRGNGDQIIELGDKSIKIRDIKTGFWRGWYHTSLDLSRQAQTSPDGRWLAIVGASEIELWDLNAGRLHRSYSKENKPTSTPVGLQVTNTSLLIVEPTSSRWLDHVDGKESSRVTLQNTSRSIATIALHPNGKEATFDSFDNPPQIFDLTTGKMVKALEESTKNTYVKELVYSYDGKYIAGRRRMILTYWDRSSGKQLGQINGVNDPPWIKILHSHPSQARLIYPKSSGGIAVLDLSTGQEEIFTHKEHPGLPEQLAIDMAALSPAGDHIAFVNPYQPGLQNYTDGVIILNWKQQPTAVPQWLPSKHSQSPPTGSAYAPKGHLYSATQDGVIHQWEPQTGKLLATQILPEVLGAHDSQFISLSPNGRYVIQHSLPLRPQPESYVWLWDREALTRSKSLYKGASVPRQVTYSRNSRYVAFAAGTKIYRWELQSQQETVIDVSLLMPDPSRDGIRTIALSSDGRWLAAANNEAAIYLWDLSKTPFQTTRIPKSGTVSDMAFTPDDKGLWIARLEQQKGRLLLFDVASGQQRRTFALDAVRAYKLAQDPTGSYIAAATNQSEVILWDAQSGKQLRTYAFDKDEKNQNAHHPQFSADGKHLIFYAAGKYHRWSCP